MYSSIINDDENIKMKELFIKASINKENDIYNEYGKNISAQKRRQDLVLWTTVSYCKNKNKI